MKRYLVLLFFLSVLFEIQAQNNKTDQAKLKEYRHNPAHWINAMDDPNANYNEAVRAFEEFWRGKPNPLELMEGEEEGEHRDQTEKLSERKREKIISYAEAYKKFIFWKSQHQGFIKSDGTLMSQEEIEALIKQELRNRQNSK